MSVESVNNSNYQAQESQNYSQNNVNEAQETSSVSESQSYSGSSNSESSSDDVEMSHEANNTRRSRVASLDDVPSEEYAEEAGEAAYETEAAESAGEADFVRSEETSALIDEIVGQYAQEHTDAMSRDDVIVLGGTNGNDKINVTQNSDGSINVNVNGKVTRYSEEEAKRLVIDAGKGDDEVTVDENVAIGMHIAGGEGNDVLKGGAGNDVMFDYYGKTTLVGGAGNDQLVAHGLSKDGKTVYDNRIVGGDGNDYIEGGKGNDILMGGEGNDVIYGLSGDDSIYGGAGHDYLDGGKGNDKVDGGAGNDRLVGGEGEDDLNGGADDDLLIGGHGSDKMDGGSGADRIVGQSAVDDILTGRGDEVEERYAVDIPDNIELIGDEMEIERMASDLEMLASTEAGAKLLASLGVSDETISIATSTSGSSVHWDKATYGYDNAVHYDVSKISLNQNNNWDERAPVVALYHELCHCYNHVTNSLDFNYYDEEGNIYSDKDKPSGSVRGLEYQAVGIEHENADIVQNDPLLTENGMREFLGYERRERY